MHSGYHHFPSPCSLSAPTSDVCNVPLFYALANGTNNAVRLVYVDSRACPSAVLALLSAFCVIAPLLAPTLCRPSTTAHAYSALTANTTTCPHCFHTQYSVHIAIPDKLEQVGDVVSITISPKGAAANIEG